MSGYRPRHFEVGKVAEGLGQMRADYDATKSSRFMRRRIGLPSMGSGADFHYKNESEYLRLIEMARDMVRNDSVIGPAISTVCLNTIQGGMQLNPDTGDKELDD